MEQAEIVGVDEQQRPKEHKVEGGKRDVGLLHVLLPDQDLLLRLWHNTQAIQCSLG